jgi:hypothetical protein
VGGRRWRRPGSFQRRRDAHQSFVGAWASCFFSRVTFFLFTVSFFFLFWMFRVNIFLFPRL